MLRNLKKAPFPWFGGKSQAASTVWAALGDVDHYIEPFAGSLAVLLNRPHEPNRPYNSETVNDLDGLLVNAWRGIQLKPDETAEAASNPVAEADLHARHLALVRWRAEHELEHLMGDPKWCDPEMAGWWLWGCSCWIGLGSGWCAGTQAWVLGPGGRIMKRKDLPPEWNARGVSRTRELGVDRGRPELVSNGRGVNHAGTREPGVESVIEEIEFHPVCMPELKRWFAYLSARLRHVRILNGDWKRCLTPGASKMLTIRTSGGKAGIFLDPPYADIADRDNNLYNKDSSSVAHDVYKWALEHGDDSDYRIVVAGFEGEYTDRFIKADWREVEWFTAGFLRGGMGQLGKNDSHQQHRERLWLSPHTLNQENNSANIFDVMSDLPQEEV